MKMLTWWAIMRIALATSMVVLSVPASVLAAAEVTARADVTAILQRDNTVEMHVWLTLSPAARAVYVVDTAGIESLDDVAVETGTPGATQRVPFQLERRPKARAICWDIPASPDARPFKLSYTLSGVASRSEGREVASWTIVADQNELVFESVSMTVLCDASMASEQIHPSLFSSAAATTCVVEDGTLKVTATGLAARSSLRLQLGFPTGTFEGRFFLNRFMKRAGGTLLMFLIPVFSFVGLLAAFWFRGRDPATDLASDASARPAAGLTAEIAGTVFDEYTESRDIAAGALELAGQGILQFVFQVGTENRPPGLCVRSVKPLDNVRPHERKIAELFAGTGVSLEPQMLAGDRSAPRETVRAAREAIYEQTARDGYFRANPATERRAFLIAGILLLGVGLVLLAWSAPSLRSVFWTAALVVLPTLMAAGSVRLRGDVGKLILGCAAAAVLFAGLVLIMPWLGDGGLTWFAKIGWGLIASSTFFFTFGPMMPQRTRKGTLEKARLIAIRKSAASDPADSGSLEVTQAEFERLLPLAVALRFKKEWVNRCAAAGVHVPSWWTIERLEGSAQAADQRSLAAVKEEFLETLSILATAVGESPAAGSGG